MNEKKILHFLATLKRGFQISHVGMGYRSDFRNLGIKLQGMENISEDVKQSARQLLDELQDYFANSRIGISEAQRTAVRELLEKLEISICGQVPLPISLFEAMRITTKRVLPQGMLYGITGANRRVTVYVDPDHGEFTSAEVIKDSLSRYLHEKGRGLQRNESITVKAAEGGCPLTTFRRERFVVSCTSVGRCSRTDEVLPGGLHHPSGTIGAIILLTSAQKEPRLGFITAGHVADSAYNSMGEVVRDGYGNDIAVTLFNADMVEGMSMFQNMVHFTDIGIVVDEVNEASSLVSAPEENNFPMPTSDPAVATVGGIRDERDSWSSDSCSAGVPQEWWSSDRACNDVRSIPIGSLVHKVGSVTGPTIGELTAGCSFENYNNGHPMCAVKWLNGEFSPFAANGDCGSVYYAVVDGRNVPFAIHIASVILASELVSLGAPLENAFFGDHNLVFDITSPVPRAVIDFVVDGEREVIG